MGSPARRRLAVAAAVGIVLLGALVAVGRWERSRNASHQNRRLAEIEALVGPLDQPALDGYRVESGFDCLTYKRGFVIFALELCFDPRGRLIEAIDRRTEARRIASLRSDPSAATHTIPRAEIDRLLRRMHAHPTS